MNGMYRARVASTEGEKGLGDSDGIGCAVLPSLEYSSTVCAKGARVVVEREEVFSTC